MIEFKKVGLVFIFIFLAYGISFSQIDTVRIRVIGLTCSSCSKSVEEKLIHVSFVKSVQMNLNRNEATILVDFSMQVNWNLLAKAVNDAGFSVGACIVPGCKVDGYKMNSKPCDENYFYVGDITMAGITKPYYTLVGKNFMEKKLYKEWQQKILMQGYVDPASVTYYYYY